MARRLLLLNGIATVAAVLQHASGWGFTALFWWADRYRPVGALPDFSMAGGLDYWMLRVLEEGTAFAPTGFLFVSGYFMAFAAGRGAAGPSWTHVGRRIRALLVPYVAWSLAIFAMRALDGDTSTARSYLLQLLAGGAADPFYYIPLITQLFLLSPFLVPLVRRHGASALWAAAALQLLLQVARYAVVPGAAPPLVAWLSMPGWFCLRRIFPFVFGIYAGLNLATVRAWLEPRRRYLPWLTLGVGVAALFEWEVLLSLSGQPWIGPFPTAIDSVYGVVVLLTFLAYVPPLPGWASEGLETLGSRSYGIYLLHAPVLEVLSRAIYHLDSPLLAHSALFQVLLLVVGLAVPTALMLAVHRSPLRPVYNHLFG